MKRSREAQELLDMATERMKEGLIKKEYEERLDSFVQALVYATLLVAAILAGK